MTGCKEDNRTATDISSGGCDGGMAKNGESRSRSRSLVIEIGGQMDGFGEEDRRITGGECTIGTAR